MSNIIIECHENLHRHVTVYLKQERGDIAAALFTIYIIHCRNEHPIVKKVYFIY